MQEEEATQKQHTQGDSRVLCEHEAFLRRFVSRVQDDRPLIMFFARLWLRYVDAILLLRHPRGTAFSLLMQERPTDRPCRTIYSQLTTNEGAATLWLCKLEELHRHRVTSTSVSNRSLQQKLHVKTSDLRMVPSLFWPWPSTTGPYDVPPRRAMSEKLSRREICCFFTTCDCSAQSSIPRR